MFRAKAKAMLREVIVLALALRSVRGYYNSGNNYYFNPYGKSSSQLYVCDNSVVRTTFLSISCDSPYSFYYGNGANRDSERCNYGDKMTLLGTVAVVDNLQYGDKIYLSLGVYDDDSNLLVATRPTNFCEDFIGGDCTGQGTYSFETKLKLGAPDGKNRTHFYPLVKMAFSTKMDYGYNLGAANMQCSGRNSDGSSYAAWSNKKMHMYPGEEFIAKNGILIGTCALLSVFALFVWRKSEQDDDDVVGLGGYENSDTEGNISRCNRQREKEMARNSNPLII